MRLSHSATKALPRLKLPHPGMMTRSLFPLCNSECLLFIAKSLSDNFRPRPHQSVHFWAAYFLSWIGVDRVLNHSGKLSQKDVVSLSGFTGFVVTEGWFVYKKNMRFQKYSNSCGRDSVPFEAWQSQQYMPKGTLDIATQMSREFRIFKGGLSRILSWYFAANTII